MTRTYYDLVGGEPAAQEVEFAGPCVAQKANRERCEGCGWFGRTLTGPDGRRGWYDLHLVSSGHIEGDCGDCWSRWTAHTVQRCRRFRDGFAAIERSLGFPRDDSALTADTAAPPR